MKTFLAVMALLALPVQAAELTVDFYWPSTRVDGSPQPPTGAGQITAARFEIGTCANVNGDEFGTQEATVVVPFPDRSFTTQVSAGIKCVRGFVLDDNNAEGPASNLGRYFPKPGILVIRTVTKVAYEMREVQNTNRYQFVSVGTVPLNRRCGQKLVDGYAVVDSARITQPLRGGVIAAKCS